MHLTLLLVIGSAAQAVAEDHVWREVIVKFASGGINLPTDTARSPLPAGTLASQSIAQAAVDFQLEEVKKLVPGFRLADTLATARTGEVVRLSNWANVCVLRFPSRDQASAFIERVASDPTIAYLEANGTCATDGAIFPNDPEFKSGAQWGHWNYGQGGGASGADIDAPQAWGITTGLAGMIVGVIDTGVSPTPEDLVGRVQGSGVVGDSHGTNVAGIIGAIADNEKGVAGIHWNPMIHAEVIGNDDGSALAVRNAASAGAVVLNNSWHVVPPGRWSGIVREAFADVYKLNRVAVAAMGNTSSYLVQYPAGLPGVIAVGNITRDDTRWPSSTMGPNIDVAAPGTDIVTTGLGFSSYPHVTGTSFATPYTSGVAALLLSKMPTLYNDDVEQILRRSADDLPPQGWDSETGSGRVNARKALELISAPNQVLHSAIPPGQGQVVSSSGWFKMKFYGVEGLSDGVQYNVRRHEVQAGIVFLPPYPAGAPAFWGRGVGTIGFNTEEPNFGVGWCEPVAASSGGATFRTHVYEVKTLQFGIPLGYFPTAPSQVQLAYTRLQIAQTPSASTSYFVPEAGPTLTPITGNNAAKLFRACPNMLCPRFRETPGVLS